MLMNKRAHVSFTHRPFALALRPWIRPIRLIVASREVFTDSWREQPFASTNRSWRNGDFATAIRWCQRRPSSFDLALCFRMCSPPGLPDTGRLLGLIKRPLALPQLTVPDLVALLESEERELPRADVVAI